MGSILSERPVPKDTIVPQWIYRQRLVLQILIALPFEDAL